MEVLDHMDKEIVDEYLVDGNYYGVPLFMELHGVIYNMDFLNQVGYEEAPATLDEFIDLNEKLIANGLPTGISPWKSGGSIVGHMTAPVFSSQENPVEYMTKIQNGEVDLTKEKGFLELFDYLDATIEYGNKDAVNTDSTKMCIRDRNICIRNVSSRFRKKKGNMGDIPLFDFNCGAYFFNYLYNQYWIDGYFVSFCFWNYERPFVSKWKRT